MSCYEKTGKRCTPDCSFTTCFWDKELKPCGHCGDTAIFITNDNRDYFPPVLTYKVSCNGCFIQTADLVMDKLQAIAAWNRRV